MSAQTTVSSGVGTSSFPDYNSHNALGSTSARVCADSFSQRPWGPARFWAAAPAISELCFFPWAGTDCSEAWRPGALLRFCFATDSVSRTAGRPQAPACVVATTLGEPVSPRGSAGTVSEPRARPGSARWLQDWARLPQCARYLPLLGSKKHMHPSPTELSEAESEADRPLPPPARRLPVTFRPRPSRPRGHETRVEAQSPLRPAPAAPLPLPARPRPRGAEVLAGRQRALGHWTARPSRVSTHANNVCVHMQVYCRAANGLSIIYLPLGTWPGWMPGDPGQIRAGMAIRIRPCALLSGVGPGVRASRFPRTQPGTCLPSGAGRPGPGCPG